MDIGTGASCIYPLLGHREFDWGFVGTDTDSTALQSAHQILKLNPGLSDAIELRHQTTPDQIFEGVVNSEERFDLTLCNPPFHASREDAQAGSRRKWKNLGKAPLEQDVPLLNFGGKASELWCVGGERAFILRMIEESYRFKMSCVWFTTLVSKESNLLAIGHALRKIKVTHQKTIEMTQGQKKSRMVAWSFQARPT